MHCQTRFGNAWLGTAVPFLLLLEVIILVVVTLKLLGLLVKAVLEAVGVLAAIIAVALLAALAVATILLENVLNVALLFALYFAKQVEDLVPLSNFKKNTQPPTEKIIEIFFSLTIFYRIGP